MVLSTNKHPFNFLALKLSLNSTKIENYPSVLEINGIVNICIYIYQLFTLGGRKCYNEHGIDEWISITHHDLYNNSRTDQVSFLLTSSPVLSINPLNDTSIMLNKMWKYNLNYIHIAFICNEKKILNLCTSKTTLEQHTIRATKMTYCHKHQKN